MTASRTSAPLRILLTGTESWALDGVRRALEAAGDEVEMCGEEPDRNGCRVERGERCPILTGIHVAVTVRAHPLAAPVRRERCLTCAANAGVPIVVAGAPYPNPFADTTAAVVHDLGSVREACVAVRLSEQPMLSLSAG